MLLLNILWFLLGGVLITLVYLLGGLVFCLTIVGIPFGVQCFKLSVLGLSPFGRDIRETEPPGGALAVILNIIWIIFFGIELAIVHFILAIILGITIIGLPFSVQHLKLARLALIPFGFRVVNAD